MKKSTQNLLRKVALLGVLGGTLWGTSIAAEPAATQQATTTHVTTASAGIEGPQTATVQDDGSNSPTIYDRMLRARSMARNQVEANTAIFLMPEANYGANRTNAGQMPNAYDRQSHRGQERQYQPNGDNRMQPQANEQGSEQGQRMERHSQPPMMNDQNGRQGQPPMGQPPMMHDRDGHQGQPPMGQPPMMNDRDGRQGQPPMGQPPMMGGQGGPQGMPPMGQPPMMGGQGGPQDMPPMGQPPMMDGQKHHEGPHHNDKKHMKKYDNNRQYEHATPTSYTDVNF